MDPDLCPDKANEGQASERSLPYIACCEESSLMGEAMNLAAPKESIQMLPLKANGFLSLDWPLKPT